MKKGVIDYWILIVVLIVVAIVFGMLSLGILQKFLGLTP